MHVMLLLVLISSNVRSYVTIRKHGNRQKLPQKVNQASACGLSSLFESILGVKVKQFSPLSRYFSPRHSCGC